MKFTTLFSALTLGASAALLAAAAPAPIARDVWAPKMTYPTADTVWESGKTYVVQWETEDAPENITNGDEGFILLRTGEYETPVVLAHGIHLRDGHAPVKVPDVITGDGYSLVLFGDSGNWGPQFRINGPVKF